MTAHKKEYMHMTTPSDTPLTDAQILENGIPNVVPKVYADFARSLERQNAALREALELLLTCFGNNSDFAKERVKVARAALRGEEA